MNLTKAGVLEEKTLSAIWNALASINNLNEWKLSN
jgi:hypothetical protein